jgi:hypothetical protein
MRPALPSSFFTMSNSPLRRLVRRSTSHSRGALCPRVLAFPFASIPKRGGRSADRRTYVVVAFARRDGSARVRRGASHDAGRSPLGAPPWRFSAGGRASISGITSGSVQRAPRSQVVVPGGRCPGPPEPAVTSRGRRTPLLAPPFRIVSRRRPSMSEDGNLCTINSLRSQEINATRSRPSCFQGNPYPRERPEIHSCHRRSIRRRLGQQRYREI